MKKAVEHVFTGDTRLTSLSYDYSKTMIGSLLKQFTGATSLDKYVSANPPQLINLNDVAVQSFFCPHVYKWSSNIYWIFAPSNATAAVTRNIALFEYNVSANSITWKGYITLSGTTIAGAKTVRGLRAYVYKHISGTVSTSGSSTSITGSGTAFSSDRIAVGARIGFGTTDPTAVSTWYEITAIGSDTGLTISSPVTLAPGTSYVIEEIRILVSCTNATLNNGGIHLIKGLHPGVFQIGGTVISEAVSTDNVRVSYLLKDWLSATFTVTIATPGVFTKAGHGLAVNDMVVFTTTGALPTGIVANTVYYVTSTSLTSDTFTVAATLGGAAIATSGSQSGTHTLHSGSMAVNMGIAGDYYDTATNHDLYLLNLDNATSVRVHKFNMRAALTVSAGLATGAWTHKTNIQTITGTAQQASNGRIFSVAHGPASGIKSLYFVTTTRVYRCHVASLVSGGAAWLEDSMIENPPGTITTNLATSSLAQVDYSATIDRLLITTTLSGRHGTYVAKYDPSNGQYEKIFGQINNRTKLLSTAAGAPDAIFPAGAMTIWTEDGYLFAIPNITTAGLNWLGILPIADGYYSASNNQYIITPRMSTAGASSLHRAYVQTNQYAGDILLGYTPEPIRLYYRINGIDDNTGEWTEIISGDLSGVTPGDYIQFKIEFEVLGEFCIPRRVYSVACVFEDNSSDTQDTHYLSSADLSSKVTKTFAWKHSVAFGTTVPTLRVRLYNAITNGILDDDDSVTQTGTWEKSTDGGQTWGAFNATDKANEITFIRFTPASIPDNVQVRALLTLA